MARDIPRFVSVDDHVVEPPHLFQKWLPKKFADDPKSPRVERKGIGKMEYKGGTTYEIEWDDGHTTIYTPAAGALHPDVRPVGTR